jgi:hypothetical protein
MTFTDPPTPSSSTTLHGVVIGIDDGIGIDRRLVASAINLSQERNHV